MKYIFAITLILVSISLRAKGQFQLLNAASDAARGKTLNHTVEEQRIYAFKRWTKFESNLKDGTRAIFKMILPYVMKSTENMNISSKCMSEAMHLVMGIKRLKPWAFKFFDSSAKMIDGMFEGTMSSLGMFDECINTEVISENSRDLGKVLYRGQYCSLSFKLPSFPKTHFYSIFEAPPELKNISEQGTVISIMAKYSQLMHFLSLRLGICVPSGCTENDINQVADKLGELAAIDGAVYRCEVKTETVYTSMEIFVICLYSFAALLTISGTTIGIYSSCTKTKFNSIPVRILKCFDLRDNFRKFANTKTSTPNLSCLHGIRFFSMTWIVLGHTYVISNPQSYASLSKVEKIAGNFAFQAIANATVSVDTFFCMGGLLVCYLTVKRVKIEKLPLDIKLYVIHRLWRILPIYIYAILSIFLLKLVGPAGPLWFETTDAFVKDCYRNWWTNVVFINNFYNIRETCFAHGWYIASDFQLYIAALLLLIPILRKPKIGISLSVMAIIAVIIYSGVATFVLDIPAAMTIARPDPDSLADFWGVYYFRPFVHAGAYVVGILAGYILITKPDLKISPVIQVAGWCLAFICNFSVLYGAHEWNKGNEANFTERLLYASFQRTAWAMGIAWMIVCCATGHGGVINRLLSWKMFIPLARLSFLVYLVHPLIQIYVTGQTRIVKNLDHLGMVYLFFGHLFATYLIAFCGSMAVEAPVLALEKLVFKRTDTNTPADPSIVKNTEILNGSLKTEKNGDIAVILTDNKMEMIGKHNDAFDCKS